ncbi:MAG: interleukin-like EMT inducer domain-containing protein, partial [Anaerolineae bacterium]|nr:interleukin-like EMT inducer domain-containing protein [Anaerolineae bacterium]
RSPRNSRRDFLRHCAGGAAGLAAFTIVPRSLLGGAGFTPPSERINIAVIDPQSGNAIDTRGFDTAANGFEADALQQFIDLIEPGQIVVAASQGEDALAYFDEGAFAALSSIGVTTPDLSAPFSAIGVKGAAPGQALQTTGSAESTAFLRRGAIPDARNLAAAVDQIIIEKP